MPQTTTYFGILGPTAAGSPRVEYNTTGGSAFTDFSGEAVSWTWGAGDRKTSETNTIDGDQPIVVPGKLNATDVTIRGIVTQASTGFWYDALQAYQGGTAVFLRFYPSGSVAGRYRVGSGTNASSGSAAGGYCYVTQRPMTNVDANAADVFTYEVVIKAAGFTAASL